MNVLNAALYFEIGGDFGRLPLTWANHSVSGLVNFVRKRVCSLYKSVQFYGKRPRRPETGLTVVGWRRLSRFPAKMTLVHVRAPLIIEKISVWLWRNGTRILFGTIRPVKQDDLSRWSVAPGNFPLERPKSRVSFTFKAYFLESFCKR